MQAVFLLVIFRNGLVLPPTQSVISVHYQLTVSNQTLLPSGASVKHLSGLYIVYVVCLLPKFTIQHIFVVIVILFCISNYQIHCFKICGDVFRANKGSEYVPKYMYSCSELKFIEKQFKKLFSTIWKASGQCANTEVFIFNVFFYELLQDIILNIENLF